jgi:hypothetical protein
MVQKKNLSLYEDKHPEKSKKGMGFKNKEKAIETLKMLKGLDMTYQKQVVNTMYNRAKYHANQTEGMRDAMKVFKKWLKSKKVKNKK